MKNIDFIEHREAVIIGCGAAGLTTALSLEKQMVLVISEGDDPFLTHTAYAQGGVAIANDGADILAHLNDTLLSGDHASDPDAVKVLVSEGPQIAEWLEKLNFFWDLDPNGGYQLGREGAHSTHRIRHAGGDATGYHLSRHLFQKARERNAIDFWFQTAALEILEDEHGICGLVVNRQGRIGLVKTRRLVLATGGYSGLYRPTTSPNLNSGEGLILAAEVGTLLRDLEMVQFHPTALNLGDRDHLPLLTEALRGAGARLVLDSNTVLPIDHPLGPLGPRDVVSRAIFLAIKEGHRVFLDATGVKDVEVRFPTVTRIARENGLSPARDLLPVTPAAHYAMGGIIVDLWGNTGIPGLWAVGEVSSTGVHGANRLASNSLLECLVFGRRVARGVQDFIPGSLRWPSIRYTARHAENLDLPSARSILGKILFKHAGPLREEADLKEGLRRVDSWMEKFGNNRHLARSGVLARAILESALARRESRGAHCRLDYPVTLDTYSSTVWQMSTEDISHLRRIPA